MSKRFTIEVTYGGDLDASEIWPDGDGPENPTIDDVIAELKKFSPRTIVNDWGLEVDVTVDNKLVNR